MVVTNESPKPEPEPEYNDSEQQRSSPIANDIEQIPNGLQEENNIERDEPIAEALIQNEKMFHHLKILKPSPSELENERRISNSDAKKINNPRKGVYSQVR